jgi:hypothetical protein
MQLAETLLRVGRPDRGGLEGDLHLVLVRDPALPAIQRATRREIRAGDESLANESVRDADRLGLRGHGGHDLDELDVVGHRP